MKKENSSPYEKYLPWVVALAMFMQSLDGTILNTALPSIAKDMHYSPLQMQSIVVSYTLTLALFIPLSGWLSDKYGSKRIFMIAVGLFTLGSACCAASYDLLTMNLSRILQAIGGSMMVPVARLAILYQYPRKDLLKIMNIITVPGLLGIVLGPTLGGWISDNYSWHWVFILNIPIGIIGIIAAKIIMPNFTNTFGKFDIKGLIIFSIALVAITFAFEMSSSNLSNWQIIISLMAFAGILFYVYYVHFKKTDSPIIDLNLFKVRTLKIGLIGSLVTRFGVSGVPFLLPLLFQVGFGYSATISGLLLLPSSIATIAIKPLTLPLIKKLGYRGTLISNTLILAGVIFLFGFISKDTPMIFTILLMIVYGAFSSIQMTAMGTITLTDVTDDQASGANSLQSIMQQLSISFGTSIAGLVLFIFTGLFVTTKGGEMIEAFKFSLITLAIMTAISSLTFTELRKTDGEILS